MNLELRLIELRVFILPSSVSPLFCDIKMFCAPFACARGRQSRLHLSQGDTTEKSECKTLISPDPDEGSLRSQRETPRSQDPYWLTSFGAEKDTKRFSTRASGVAAAERSDCAAAAAACMCVLYRWLVWLCMSVCMQMRAGRRAAAVAGVHMGESLHLQHKCL